MLVAQKQEVSPAEVAVPTQHHELRQRVILHLVDHDEARITVGVARKQKAQVHPFERGKVGPAGDAGANARDVQPREVVDLADSTSPLDLNIAARPLLKVFLRLG